MERKQQGNEFEFGGFNFDLLERSENFKEYSFWVFPPNSRILPYWVFEYLVVCRGFLKGKSENTQRLKEKEKTSLLVLFFCCLKEEKLQKWSGVLVWMNMRSLL